MNINDLFRAERGQILVESKEDKKEIVKRDKTYYKKLKPKIALAKKDTYNDFLNKYDNLDVTIDDFNLTDLCHYFVTVSKESGYPYYFVSESRDKAIFKKLKTKLNLSNREICRIISFIFESDQPYINKDKVQPTILNSSYLTKLVKDSEDWINDRYDAQKDIDSKKEKIRRNEKFWRDYYKKMEQQRYR